MSRTDLNSALTGAADAGTARALSTDARALDRLRREAGSAPDKALAGAAKQFEAVFMQMLLKSMREALPQSGMLDNEGSKLYTGMLDSELAQRMASKGLGLADLLVKQMSRGQPGGATGGATGGPGAVNAPAKTSGAAEDGIKRLSAATAGANGSAQAFVDRMLPHAEQAEQATGVPARFILGQAALESGWGKREIRGADGTSSFNLFGIKAGKGWTGSTTAVTTTEYVNGTPSKVVEKFRAYGSYGEAFADYAKLLSSNPRYAGVLAQGRDAAGFAQGLQRAGYATDPNYADKLTRVINHTLALGRMA